MESQNNQKVLDHLYLVKDFVRIKIRARELPRSLDKDDIIQIGNLALINAASHFVEVPGGAKFSTYADKVIRKQIYRAIINARFGPKNSQYWRDKKKGIRHLDMESYDALPVDKHGGTFLDNVPSDILNEEKWMMRIKQESLERILKSVRLMLKQKIDKRNKCGGAGVYWKEEYQRYIARISVCGKKFNIGHFINASEAIEARIDFLHRLEKYCILKIEAKSPYARSPTR